MHLWTPFIKHRYKFSLLELNRNADWMGLLNIALNRWNSNILNNDFLGKISYLLFYTIVFLGKERLSIDNSLVMGSFKRKIKMEYALTFWHNSYELL